MFRADSNIVKEWDYVNYSKLKCNILLKDPSCRSQPLRFCKGHFSMWWLWGKASCKDLSLQWGGEKFVDTHRAFTELIFWHPSTSQPSAGIPCGTQSQSQPCRISPSVDMLWFQPCFLQGSLMWGTWSYNQSSDVSTCPTPDITYDIRCGADGHAWGENPNGPMSGHIWPMDQRVSTPGLAENAGREPSLTQPIRLIVNKLWTLSGHSTIL